jgi:hypothetical protein
VISLHNLKPNLPGTPNRFAVVSYNWIVGDIALIVMIFTLSLRMIFACLMGYQNLKSS